MASDLQYFMKSVGIGNICQILKAIHKSVTTSHLYSENFPINCKISEISRRNGRSRNQGINEPLV